MRSSIEIVENGFESHLELLIERFEGMRQQGVALIQQQVGTLLHELNVVFGKSKHRFVAEGVLGKDCVSVSPPVVFNDGMRDIHEAYRRLSPADIDHSIAEAPTPEIGAMLAKVKEVLALMDKANDHFDRQIGVIGK